jgi:hypothetical protein
MQEQRQADEADRARNAAGEDRHQLLRLGREDVVIDRRRRQQPHEMPEEQEQDPDMEQVGTPAQLARTQHLAGTRAPGILLAIEAHEAADQEHAEADVGIDLEEELGEIGVHRALPFNGR